MGHKKNFTILVAAICGITCFFFSTSIYAQSSKQDTTRNLYYAAKVWGYLKYFDPTVNGCNENMDSILIALIPEFESDATDSAFNTSLLKLFEFAGPMPTATTPAPSLAPDQTINLELTWLHDPIFSSSIRAHLDSIQVNFRPAQNCYYEFNPDSNTTGALYNINENDYAPMLAITEPYRLLTLFRVWNIYDYFYPYKTLLDSSWDSTLLDMIPICREAETTLAFHLALMQFQSKLQDAHAFSGSTTLTSHFGSYYFPMLFSYIDSQTVISKVFQGVTTVKPGDVVLQIDGTSTQVIRDSLRKYAPGGNPAVIDRNISETLLQGLNSTSTLVVDDGNGQRTVSLSRNASETAVYDSIDYWQGDGSHWKVLSGDIGYVNMGIVDENDLVAALDSLQNAPAIIFDMRNYPTNDLLYQWCDSLLPQGVWFATFFEPDATYPGTLRYYSYGCGPYPSNPNYYQGQVILLVNEITQSAQEFQAMALSMAPNVLIVGSQTAGADGNVNYTTYPTEIYMYYTSLGVSYYNGTQTQRVGIVPNVVVHPTIQGIRADLDEVLDTAIILAGGTLSVPNPKLIFNSFAAYPNPFTHSTTLAFTSAQSGYATVTLVNPLGQVVSRVFQGELIAGAHSFPITVPTALPAGMYECVVRMNGQLSQVGMIVQ